MADDQQPKKKPKVPPPPPHPNTGKEVWFACRATPGCEGKKAVMVFVKGVPGHDSVTRYRCTTCNGAWHVRI